MWPRIGPVETYGPIYMFGMCVQYVFAVLIARRLGLKRYVGHLVGVSYSLGMIVGAKVLFDLQAGDFSFRELISFRHYMQGGMWGGPLAYLSLAVPLMLIVSNNRRAAVDLVALAAPIPMAIAKIACLCNGCCYGKPCRLPWAVIFPKGDIPTPAGVPMHPTQVYEMLVAISAAVVLFLLNRPRWRGVLLFWFLAVYDAGRALTELFRGDLSKQQVWGPLTRSQWLCALAAAVSICILFIYARSKPVIQCENSESSTVRL